MRDDIENQSAAFLAKEVDPQGHRTIGVLTKPDTLLAGEYGPWLEVLQNRRHSLRHGYYMTKHPSTDELSKKLSFEEARTREKDYFEDPTNPWWENDATRKRLGTRNLTASLSKLLSSLIDETLPKLREDASKSLQEARNAYSELPPPVNVTNPTAELLNMITTFSNEFHHYTAGSSNSYASMIQKYKPAFKIFKFNVRKTAPDFRPYTIQEAKDNSLGWEEVLPDDDDDEHSAALEKQQQPIPDNVLEELSVQDVDAVKTIETRLERLHPVFVDQVKTYINGSLTRELPFNVPFSAKDGLIQHSMVLWEGHALDCFKFVRAVVADHLSKLVDKHFGRFVSSGLTDAVGSVVQRIVDRYEHKTIKRIKWMLRLEQRPFTQNNHYFSAYRENYLSKYKGARRRQQQGDSGNDEEREQKMREALAKLTELGFSASSPEDLEKLSSSNSYEEELTVMAEVRAYWQVAYKRIIDVLPLSIDEDFICAIAAKTQEMMVTELGLSDTDATEKVRAYIAEDPELAEERNVVNARLKRAEEVWSSLAMFKA
ncbi:hypothetical protein FRC03_003997 [Tulasnella sp. 419]|nr:hypothetical protein FRC03_003997 [Tulasnella sp. 419]